MSKIRGFVSCVEGKGVTVVRACLVGLMLIALRFSSSATSWAGPAKPGTPVASGTSTAVPTTTPVAVHTPTATPRPPAPNQPLVAAARALMSQINRDRAAHGAGALALDGRLSQCSEKHSKHMARIGMLVHDQFPSDVCIVHTWAAENIGVMSGTYLQSALLVLDSAMMHEGPCPHRTCSPSDYALHGHYLNLINPVYKRAGIGIYVARGAIWLTEDFTN